MAVIERTPEPLVPPAPRLAGDQSAIGSTRPSPMMPFGVTLIRRRGIHDRPPHPDGRPRALGTGRPRTVVRLYSGFEGPRRLGVARQ